MLAGPLRRRRVLIGKWLGASLSLIVSFVVASLAGVVYLLLARRLAFSPVEWARVALLLAACVLYGLAFTGLGLLISAWAPTRKSAIIASLSFWLVLVLVLPNLAVLAAGRARPLPNQYESSSSALAQARAIEAEAEAANPKAGAFNQPGYGKMHESAGPRIRQVVKRAEDDYIARKLGRDQMARILARMSPVSSFTYAMTDLAGTGVSEYQSYIEKLQRVRDRQIQLADEKQTSISIRISTPEERAAASKKLEEFFNRSKQLELELRDSLLQPRSPVQAIRDALPDLVLLISWAGLLIIGAALIFDRADVR